MTQLSASNIYTPKELYNKKHKIHTDTNLEFVLFFFCVIVKNKHKDT